MKKYKAILALLLALVMVVAIAGCASKKDPEESAAPDASASAAPDASGEEFGSYTVGYNNLGTGVWILDTHQALSSNYLEYAGCTVNAASANFSSDQMLKDIQNQISAGEDGHMYFGAFGTLTQAVSDLFENAGVYWVNWDQQISTDLIDEIRENPYFVGSLGADQVAVAENLAQMAYDLGYRKALQMAGAIGDAAHDARMNGFEKRFTELGGEVLAIGRCTDPSEAAAKGDDLIAAYGTEADCFYALNMDFALGAYNAMEKYGVENDIVLFSSEADAWGVEMIKAGKLIGDTYVAHDGAFGAALLVNALDGHALLDENGEAPYNATFGTWIINAERADFYQAHFVDGFPVTDADFESLLYRYNPDVTYESFAQMFSNYADYDYTASAWGE